LSNSLPRSVLRHLRTLFDVGTVGSLTDAQLLHRFLARDGEGAEMAFAALVERHGPMVRHVCRTILRDPHRAEDAFQATFLVLARRAGTIRRRSSAASWLHGVARRVAACARTSEMRRRHHEQRAAGLARLWIRPDPTDDLAEILHAEVERLSAPYRAVVVLCDLEGMTEGQAAQRLGWPIGTVRSRRTRGREYLRKRLIRRGLAPSLGMLGVELATSARAAVPFSLLDSTVRAAMGAASWTTTGVVSVGALALTQEVFKAMIWTKIKVAAVGVLVVGLTGAAVFAWQDTGSNPVRGESTKTQSARGEPSVAESKADIDELIRHLDTSTEEFLRQVRNTVQAVKLKVEPHYSNKSEPDSEKVRQDFDDAIKLTARLYRGFDRVESEIQRTEDLFASIGQDPSGGTPFRLPWGQQILRHRRADSTLPGPAPPAPAPRPASSPPAPGLVPVRPTVPSARPFDSVTLDLRLRDVERKLERLKEVEKAKVSPSDHPSVTTSVEPSQPVETTPSEASKPLSLPPVEQSPVLRVDDYPPRDEPQLVPRGGRTLPQGAASPPREESPQGAATPGQQSGLPRGQSGVPPSSPLPQPKIVDYLITVPLRGPHLTPSKITDSLVTIPIFGRANQSSPNPNRSQSGQSIQPQRPSGQPDQESSIELKRRARSGVPVDGAVRVQLTELRLKEVERKLDRLKDVEQKLDRVLRALETSKAPQPEPAGSLEAIPSATPAPPSQ
jgi:RNA polymerase sigma factor (sigma-70 family)